MCTGYRYRGDLITEFPEERDWPWPRLEPVYEEIEGWMSPTTGAKNEADLPAKARRYLERLEELIGVPFCLISTGAAARRDDPVRGLAAAPVVSHGSLEHRVARDLGHASSWRDGG